MPSPGFSRWSVLFLPLAFLLLSACKKGGGSPVSAGLGSTVAVVATTGTGSTAPQPITPPPPSSGQGIDPTMIQPSGLRVAEGGEEEESLFPDKLFGKIGSTFRLR